MYLNLSLGNILSFRILYYLEIKDVKVVIIYFDILDG